jgi:60 kDa SS-A/Ro ribonucleoprotein
MNLFRTLFRGRSAGTSQLASQPERDQVLKSACGYVYALDPWERVDRFLILGSDGGSHYVNERVLAQENALHLAAMIREDGIGVVRRIVKISESGRAPKVSPAIFALAMCAGSGDEATRRLALGRGLQAVCRTGSHLLEFASYIESFAAGYARCAVASATDMQTSRSANSPIKS